MSQASLLYQLKEIFKEEGFAPDTASDGIEALKLIKEKKYDIILLDLIMENMDGLETVKEIHAINPSTLIYMMTGYSSDNRIEEASHLGVIKIFQKPFDIEKMIKVIKETASQTLL